MSTKATSKKSRKTPGGARKERSSHRAVIEGGKSSRITHKLGTMNLVVSLTSPEGYSVFGSVAIEDPNYIVVRPGFYSSSQDRWVDIRGKVIVRIEGAYR
jgi:hypothetical protein